MHMGIIIMAFSEKFISFYYGPGVTGHRLRPTRMIASKNDDIPVLMRRVHQGCPLPPLLYALSTRPLTSLSSAEREAGRLEGIPTGQFTLLLYQLLSDDVGIFLNDQRRIQVFERTSRARLIIEKFWSNQLRQLGETWAHGSVDQAINSSSRWSLHLPRQPYWGGHWACSRIRAPPESRPFKDQAQALEKHLQADQQVRYRVNPHGGRFGSSQSPSWAQEEGTEIGDASWGSTVPQTWPSNPFPRHSLYILAETIDCCEPSFTLWSHSRENSDNSQLCNLPCSSWDIKTVTTKIWQPLDQRASHAQGLLGPDGTGPLLIEQIRGTQRGLSSEDDFCIEKLLDYVKSLDNKLQDAYETNKVGLFTRLRFHECKDVAIILKRWASPF